MVQKVFLRGLSLLLASALVFSSCNKDNKNPKVKEDLSLGGVSLSDCKNDKLPYTSFRTGSQEQKAKERVVFEALDGGTLKVSHLDWSATCGLSKEASSFDMKVEGNKIILKEQVIDHNLFDCRCIYDNSVEIKGLSEGTTYVLQFTSSQNGYLYFTKHFNYTKDLKEVVYAKRD